ncbi:hypothetical protein MA16_Dca025359 [Dendrobium catenatum]|uniref:Uncharacterized protein n=1 Tax=Dendrobium catenatum TaxID=906689 RepID=A0A2I0VUX4_9ASPA|nr:hypothetical protein MA16_Dca025357 [Dendrobium catenatum]PKU67206.1 hypothetical protein MA16_Dca025359 [Dendrobium catenatum]
MVANGLIYGFKQGATCGCLVDGEVGLWCNTSGRAMSLTKNICIIDKVTGCNTCTVGAVTMIVYWID